MSQNPQNPKRIVHLPKTLSGRQITPTIIKSAPRTLVGTKIRSSSFMPTLAKPSTVQKQQVKPSTNLKTPQNNVKPGSSVKVTGNKVPKEVEDAKLRAKNNITYRIPSASEAEVQKEITWRSKTCAHRGYDCTLPVLQKRDYCARHILADATAPYKQCSYNYASGKRCPLPAPLHTSAQSADNRQSAFCFEHARAAQLSRHRSTVPPPPVTTTETLLNQLQHYVKPERTRTTSCASTVSVVSDPADQDLALPPAVDPFKQIDSKTVNNGFISSITECCTDSDSDCDSVTLGVGGTCRGGPELDTSGDEDTAYDRHPLRHAGVFTAEESVSEMRTALRLLQAGYLKQMGRLRVLLQMARAQYLRQLRQEKETHCSINTQARNGQLTVHERKQLKKLKAYAGFHRKHGVDAVLARKLYHKRAKLMSSGREKAAQGKCTFSEGGVRCINTSAPAAKHCLKHITQDHHQVLFSECGDNRSGMACKEPVPRLSVTGLGCRYHTDPPSYTVFQLTKDDSGSDSETNTATDIESHAEMEITDPPSIEASNFAEGCE